MANTQTDRQTDEQRETDRKLTMAIPFCVLRASGAKTLLLITKKGSVSLSPALQIS